MLAKCFKLVVCTILASFLLKIILRLNFTNPVYNHSPGPCQFVEGVEEGSEDIEILSNGLSFVTTGLKYFKRDGKYDSRILLIDLNYPKTKPIDLEIIGNFSRSSFVAHGISSWVDKNTGTITLFVVNHSPQGDRVEIFQFDVKEYALKYIKTIIDENMFSLNDLVAVNDVAFYFSNDGYFRSSFLNLLTGFLPLGSIGYFNGRKSIMMNRWISSANGINIAPNKNYLYVASVASQSLLIFEIKKDKSLHLNSTVALYSGIDNINIDHMTGDLWIGSHPKLYKVVLRFLYNSSLPTPSQVLKLTMGVPNVVTSVTEVYSNNGSELSSSSVAAYFKNHLLIGTVDHKLLYCYVKVFR